MVMSKQKILSFVSVRVMCLKGGIHVLLLLKAQLIIGLVHNVIDKAG